MLGRQLKRNFTREFISYSKHTNLYSGISLCFYIAQLILLLIIGNYLIITSFTYQIPLLLVTMFLIATRLRAFNNIVHECTHYSFCQDKKYNILFGKIAASIIFTSYHVYKDEHMSHHKNLGDYQKDLDFHHRRKFKIEDALSFKIIMRHILTPIAGFHFPQYFAFDLSFKDGRFWGLLKTTYLILILISGYFFLNATLLLIIIPYVWIFTAINYWTDCVDHAGRLEEGDDLYKSRNFIVSKPIRTIFFPRNDCYHLIHHLFPSIPVQHLDDAHAVLMGDRDYLQASKHPGNAPKHKIIEAI